MKSLADLSTPDLRRVIALKEQIETLEAHLEELTGGATASISAPAPGKRKLSPAHRRKLIQALARARAVRWGKVKKSRAASAPKKRKMSAAGRAAISSAAKARWAKFHAKKAA